MKHINKIVAVVALVLTAFSCSDPYKNDTFVMYDIQPASTYLSSRPNDFSEWVTVMKYADMYNAVNQATEHFTLFAPNNEAMKAFYAKKGVKGIEELGREYARNLVSYHLIKDTISQSDFISKEGQLEKKTVSDDYLTVTIRDGEGEQGGINSIYLNNEAHVIEFANKVSNGYVYVLANTLTPLTESVYERLEEHKNQYSLMKAAIDATGFNKSLGTIFETVTDAQGKSTTQKTAYTLLAPTDEAFHKAGVRTLEELVAKLGAGSDYTEPSNALYQYVAYHILQGSFTFDKLKTFDKADATSKLWNTMADNAVLRVNFYDNAFYLNYNDPNSRSQFVEGSTDITARNGYIHGIDSYMPIAVPEPEEVLFDVTAYPELEKYVNAYKPTGMTYQAGADVEYNCPLPTDTPLPYYEIHLNNPSNFAQKVTYFTAKTSSVWVDAEHADFLMLNLGYNGWISMKTPTLVKGKYKVTMQFGFATSMDFIRTATGGSNGGEMIVSFDGSHQKNIKPYMTVPSKTLGNYQYVMYDEIEFDNTSSHTFKILINDPVASTNSNYRIMIDYLRFEPVGIVK